MLRAGPMWGCESQYNARNRCSRCSQLASWIALLDHGFNACQPTTKGPHLHLQRKYFRLWFLDRRSVGLWFQYGYREDSRRKYVCNSQAKKANQFDLISSDIHRLEFSTTRIQCSISRSISVQPCWCLLLHLKAICNSTNHTLRLWQPRNHKQLLINQVLTL